VLPGIPRAALDQRTDRNFIHTQQDHRMLTLQLAKLSLQTFELLQQVCAFLPGDRRRLVITHRRISILLEITNCALATYGAYQIHMTSRQLFLQSIEVRAEQVAREDSDNARLDWLENMARFLRHELRNTMIGISSSLDLLSRKSIDTDAEVYVRRAHRSFTYMRKLVADPFTHFKLIFDDQRIRSMRDLDEPYTILIAR
jgi:signal transduction histidine kinase